MKKFKIGLLEIPISTREVYTGYDDIETYKFASKGFPKTGNLREYLENKLNKEFENIEIENSYLDLGQRGELLNITDFKRIGIEFKELAKKYDFLMVFGENHSAAYPLYYCPGKVLRIDCHGDAFFNKSRINKHLKNCGNPWLNYATYMYFVDHNKIKSPSLIDNIGIIYNPVIGAEKTMGTLESNYDIIDIDLDGFKDKYHMQFIHNAERNSFISVSETLKKFSYFRPKVIGIYEYIENDDKYNNVPKLAYILAKMAISNIIDNA